MQQFSMFEDVLEADDIEPIESIIDRCEMAFEPGIDSAGLIDLVSSKKFHPVEIKAGPALGIFNSPNGLVIVFAGGLSKRPENFMQGYKGRVVWLSALEWLEVISSGQDVDRLRISKNFLYSLSAIIGVKEMFSGSIRLSVGVKILAFGIDPCRCPEWRDYLNEMRANDPDVYRQWLEYAKLSAGALCDGAPAEFIPPWAKKTAQSWALAQLSRRGRVALLPPWYAPSPKGEWINHLRARLIEWEEDSVERNYEISKRARTNGG
jgi:hypothetical protein